MNREMLISEVGRHARRAIKRSVVPLAVLTAIGALTLYLTDATGTFALLLICGGTLVMLSTWGAYGRGLPILPMFAVQNLVAYALPIVTRNESVYGYPATFVTHAGWEVFAFSLAAALAWRFSHQFLPAPSPYCYALHGFSAGSVRLARFAMIMIVASSIWELARTTDTLWYFLALLPYGSESIVRVLVSAVGACGFFLGAMMIGNGTLRATQAAVFWALLALQCFITASGFLLSAAALTVFATSIGLFWGSGRVPWRFLFVSLAIFAFLNLGKFTMRDRYWANEDGENTLEIHFGEMPRYYGEWIGASVDILEGKTIESKHANAFSKMGNEDETASGQNLLQRINNLQNLLFVIDAVEVRHIPTLQGATYTLIPPLLVPRILWPDKPRSHEGQVLLNVHFGRQAAESTLRTYVAWGLLAEAYGNFGAITGALLLGAFLGCITAWFENVGAKKLLLSVEGFLSFTIFLGLANSFEMVASVLITSLFQACIPIVAASWPFVRRTNVETLRRPEHPAT